MNKVELKDLVGGALQEKFNKAFEKVVENLQDSNTSFKTKRKITITLSFDQNETRDDVSCSIDVSEKLAPQSGIRTSFFIGKDLKTGEVFAEEYGKQIKGQVSINDLAKEQEKVEQVGDKIINPETGEVLDTVVDFRKAAGE